MFNAIKHNIVFSLVLYLVTIVYIQLYVYVIQSIYKT